MARPTKRTPEIERIILEGLRAGMTETAAAARAGVAQDQIRRWKQRFAGFAADCTRAEGEAEARFTGAIAQAAAPHDVVETTETVAPDGRTIKTVTRREFDWRAALEWLQRRRYSEWGQRKQLDIKDLSADQLFSLLRFVEDEGEGTDSEGNSSARPGSPVSPYEP